MKNKDWRPLLQEGAILITGFYCTHATRAIHEIFEDVVIVATDPEIAWERAAISLLEIGTSNEMIEMHRLLLMEARRFPDLINESYDERGALVDMAPLSDYLQYAFLKKQLHFDDVDLATEQCVYLVLGGIRTRILRGVGRPPNRVGRQQIVRQAVQVFLYGSGVEPNGAAKAAK